VGKTIFYSAVSKAELKARIELSLKEVNEEPGVFKWNYKLAALHAESVAT
jgi:hypothetical protein